MIIKYLSYNSLTVNSQQSTVNSQQSTVNSQQSTVNSKINISFGIAFLFKTLLIIASYFFEWQKSKQKTISFFVKKRNKKTNARIENILVKVLIFIKGIFFNLYSLINNNNNNYAFSFNASKMSQRLSYGEIISLFNSFFNYGELGFYHKNYFNHSSRNDCDFKNNFKNNFYGESRIRYNFRNNFKGFLFNKEKTL